MLVPGQQARAGALAIADARLVAEKRAEIEKKIQENEREANGGNNTTIGYSKEKIKEFQERLADIQAGRTEKYIRGTGLFIYAPYLEGIGGAPTKDHGSRLLFPVSLTPEQVDRILPPPKAHEDD